MRTTRAASASVKPWRVKLLDAGFQRALEIIDALDDSQLVEVGVYEWAGKWPIARWLSINTARQYATARTYVRRAIRASRL